MRLGSLGLPELLVIVFVLVLVVGIVWFLLRSLASIVRDQWRKREALERIAESAALKTSSTDPEHTP